MGMQKDVDSTELGPGLSSRDSGRAVGFPHPPKEKRKRFHPNLWRADCSWPPSKRDAKEILKTKDLAKARGGFKHLPNAGHGGSRRGG